MDSIRRRGMVDVVIVAVAAAALGEAGGKASAQCTAGWDREIGLTGLADGHAGPMAAWDDGKGERLYVGGSFTSVDGQLIRGIGQWDAVGRAWAPVADGCFTPFTNSFVSAICVHDDGVGEDLYAGGWFGTAGGVGGTTNLARFDGSGWSGVGPVLGGTVWSIASWGDSLYVGGGFVVAGNTTVNGVARWDGEAWNALETGMNGGFSPGVFAMHPFNDGTGEKLYVAGRFAAIGGVTGLIGRWTGTAWEAVGNGVRSGGTFAGIECMAVFDEDGEGARPPALYVGGWELSLQGLPLTSAAKWDGTSWQVVGQYVGGRTTSLSVFDDGTGPALYAGGTAQPGISYFAKLVNNEWVPAFGGISGSGIPPSNFPSVFGLYNWNGALVVAGSFTQAGDASNGGGAANGIAIVTGCPECPADFNNDGEPNSQDFFDFLGAFFAAEPEADFNDDGAVNSQDFFDFLAVFFVGC